MVKETAAGCGITLHPGPGPSVDEAQAWEEEPADILHARGFGGDWESTTFGSLVEDLIDFLHRCAYPDEH